MRGWRVLEYVVKFEYLRLAMKLGEAGSRTFAHIALVIPQTRELWGNDEAGPWPI